MKYPKKIVARAVFLSFVANLSAETSSSMRRRSSIILFGDSLTQFAFGLGEEIGWGSLLSSAYVRRADVFNRGYSGYNTRWALDILPRVFEQEEGNNSTSDILFCVVLLGSNDACVEGTMLHVPINEFENNLNKIIAGIREHLDVKRKQNPTPIIIVTPPPVDEVRWDAFCGTLGGAGWRDNKAVKAYGEVAKGVAEKFQCCYIFDAFTYLGGLDCKDDLSSTYLADGIHLTGKGSAKFFEGLMSTIQTKLPHLKPMPDEDGDGRFGSEGGIPMQEKIWQELYDGGEKFFGIGKIMAEKEKSNLLNSEN